MVCERQEVEGGKDRVQFLTIDNTTLRSWLRKGRPLKEIKAIVSEVREN
jgi:hypothetical protein